MKTTTFLTGMMQVIQGGVQLQVRDISALQQLLMLRHGQLRTKDEEA